MWVAWTSSKLDFEHVQSMNMFKPMSSTPEKPATWGWETRRRNLSRKDASLGPLHEPKTTTEPQAELEAQVGSARAFERSEKSEEALNDWASALAFLVLSAIVGSSMLVFAKIFAVKAKKDSPLKRK